MLKKYIALHFTEDLHIYLLNKFRLKGSNSCIQSNHVTEKFDSGRRMAEGVNYSITSVGAYYSKAAGLIYIFNLIVGTGALTMPKAFQSAGWILSLIVIVCLAFMSYLTVTFVTEAMALANAISSGNDEYLSEDQPLLVNRPRSNSSAGIFEISERIELAAFSLTLGPFVFFNVQKTKYLQYFTTLTRWLAFGVMIILAVIRLSKKEGKGHPSVADFSGIPNLFGVCVYSFMCHHSLPSLITPIRNKSKLYWMIGGDYILILAFYALVSFTGIYAFSEINDLYTLNFLPDECDSRNSITNIAFFQYFLALFPVFTLSTNFPIISITLRNNLKTLFYNPSKPYSWSVDRIVFPLLAITPPVLIAFITNEVEFLVGITGSYAGTGIQYIIPALLVYFGRKNIKSVVDDVDSKNKYSSPFSHTFWVVFVCLWAVIFNI
ncbi:hypothetical protein KUTeg_003015 [Tegillarca granosa]|uniref:Amino acid transporter transmembrane domain-containing protein n=1 Tax=Tegillarca granosa TaxID=220873 RepID=A0ABQ9FKX1_TEGGR|nr:hypothetical protein KUTeg_003015 [Tegillarca granosa]